MNLNPILGSIFRKPDAPYLYFSTNNETSVTIFLVFHEVGGLWKSKVECKEISNDERGNDMKVIKPKVKEKRQTKTVQEQEKLVKKGNGG